ncbi:hypothetical protein Pmani_015399 [Petrolisthes manimaculis]|uniref:Ionotropic glutamate receptor C-terminal domain-containing protein n=1 Tax=Petrolisthes manimaculis TaxID=1843537 RepID=A0AAE1PUH4_9EUCA|nr:hypothetical protein Pmani_015399 [Petrolisthes manimaculis]
MSTVLVNVRYEPFTLPGNDMEAGLLVSLVLFLLQPSQHTEVVIIHDYTLPGVKELAESFSERWAATTLLTATPAPDLSQLLVALTSFHTNDLRYLVLLCSANTTRTVFDMVGLAVQESFRLYKIYRSYVNHKNQVRFEEVGTWRGQTTGSLSRPLFPDILKLYRNFQGRQLVTAAVDYWPFFEVKLLENGTAVPGNGIDISILNTIGRNLNFTYRVQVPADLSWGNLQEDGTVTGIVGEVFARRAHFAIDEITITESRETVLDFTRPYYFDTTTIISRAPTEKNRSLAIFNPFSSQTWIIVVLVTLLMGPLGYLFSRVHHQLTQTFDSTHNERSRNVGPSFDSGRIKWGSEPGLRGVEMFCFNMFRTIIIQGNLLPASSWPLRLVFFSWYAVCVILYAVYAGTLTAYLTKPSFEKPINSLEDLLAARDRGIVGAVVKDSNMDDLFKVHNSIQDHFKVVEKNIPQIAATIGLEIYAVIHLDEAYHIASNNFNPQPYGIVCPSGAPYTDTLNLVLGRMVQSGVVDKWYSDEITKLKLKDMVEGGGTYGEQDRIKSKPLTLDHLQV